MRVRITTGRLLRKVHGFASFGLPGVATRAPLSSRLSEKALFGSLSFSLGGFVSPAEVHWASGWSHLFTFCDVSIQCELSLPCCIRVSGTKDMTGCQNSEVCSRSAGQVTKQGCLKSTGLLSGDSCESLQHVSAVLKREFRTERNTQSTGWMERCHKMF